jgi:hypothetical protein
MKPMRTALAALAAFAASALLMPVHAVPPTVTPSPGYDARLQEQRAATPIYTPAPPKKPPSKKRPQPQH